MRKELTTEECRTPRLAYLRRGTPADQPELVLVWDERTIIVPITKEQNLRLSSDSSYFAWASK